MQISFAKQYRVLPELVKECVITTCNKNINYGADIEFIKKLRQIQQFWPEELLVTKNILLHLQF